MGFLENMDLNPRVGSRARLSVLRFDRVTSFALLDGCVDFERHGLGRPFLGRNRTFARNSIPRVSFSLTKWDGLDSLGRFSPKLATRNITAPQRKRMIATIPANDQLFIP